VSEVPAATRAAHTQLPRRLGLWSAVAVLVGSTIGSGIFRVPSTVAEATGAVGAASLLWLLGGIIAVCGALNRISRPPKIKKFFAVVSWLGDGKA